MNLLAMLCALALFACEDHRTEVTGNRLIFEPDGKSSTVMTCVSEANCLEAASKLCGSLGYVRRDIVVYGGEQWVVRCNASPSDGGIESNSETDPDYSPKNLEELRRATETRTAWDKRCKAAGGMPVMGWGDNYLICAAVIAVPEKSDVKL